MAVELQMLAWSVVLGLVQILLAAFFVTRERGLAWNAGARDKVLPPPSGVGGRLERASRNFLETFPLFAAAVLAVMLAGVADERTALGAQLYFWARVAYVPLYAWGVPYVRSLAWAVSIAGLVMVVLLTCGRTCSGANNRRRGQIAWSRATSSKGLYGVGDVILLPAPSHRSPTRLSGTAALLFEAEAR